MTLKSIATIILFGTALTACNKSSTEAPPAASATPSASVPLSDEALDQAQIPVKEDFEAQAQTAITDDNLDDQVAQLQTEIENDK